MPKNNIIDSVTKVIKSNSEITYYRDSDCLCYYDSIKGGPSMYLVSSCLVGVKCRYDGMNVPCVALQELFQNGQALPVCPELLGGLGCPRECSEIITERNGTCRVITKTNKDVSIAFATGALKTLELCQTLGITTAILKSRSPSCGYGKIYDGTFTGTLINGNGLTAELLAQNDIKVFNELTWQQHKII